MAQQGRILDPAGGAVTGEHDVEVLLYDSVDGAVPVWTETFSAVRLADGYFQVVLGADPANQLDHTVLADELWVGLAVDGNALGDLQPIGSVPSAVHSVHSVQADRAALADSASTADFATTAGSATSADSASTADFATSAGSATTAVTATTAAFATSAGSAASADTADFATTASTAASATTASSANTADSASTAGFATNAGTVGGRSTSQLASPGTYDIVYGSCAWTRCLDTPATAVCPTGRFATRIELPEFGGDQSTCGNEDDFRIYCCAARVVIPGAN